MTVEIKIPEDWPPGLAFAVAQLIRQSVEDGFPIVVPLRKDATPDQIAGICTAVQTMVRDAGLAA